MSGLRDVNDLYEFNTCETVWRLRGVAIRRPRFDLHVHCNGEVNTQISRSAHCLFHNGSSVQEPGASGGRPAPCYITREQLLVEPLFSPLGLSSGRSVCCHAWDKFVQG